MTSLAGFSLNSGTVPWLPLPEFLDAAVDRGYGAVGIWRTHFDDYSARAAAQMIRDRGLAVSSVCRVGMFTNSDQDSARRDNIVGIQQAAEVEARALVVVVGGTSGRGLPADRGRVHDELALLDQEAARAGVQLSVEPMHPMLTESRSVVTSLAEVNLLVSDLPRVGITLDCYHLWWDAQLPEGARDAYGRVNCVQLADWLSPTRDITACRGVPGEGAIDMESFLEVAQMAGFAGSVEVEVLSEAWWNRGPTATLDAVDAGLNGLQADAWQFAEALNVAMR